MHKLAQRQLRRFFTDLGQLPPEVAEFARAVSEAYQASDRDRELFERSLAIATEELLERNRQLERYILEYKAAELELDRFFAVSLDLFCIADTEGRFTRVNPLWEPLLGFQPCEMVGQPLVEFVHPQDRDRMSARIARLMMGEDVTAFECRWLRKDGQTLWFSFSCRGLGGKNQLLYGVARNVTATKAVELDLRQSQKLEAVGQLAAGIAHEINTPIQFVGDSVQFLKEGFTALQQLLAEYRRAVHVPPASAVPLREALLQKEEELDAEYLMENIPKAVERTLDGVERVAELVRAMKEFAHPDRKEKVPTDLNRALQSTLTVARNEIKYVADVETDFGELPKVLCRPGDINQVFLNLLVNAADSIRDLVANTGQKGRIRVRTRQVGGQAEVSISDTGGGIPEQIRARIFEPFFTTKEVGRGTGQGLTLARSIVVERHGGTLRFESESGVGTTFFIGLPLPGPAGAT